MKRLKLKKLFLYALLLSLSSLLLLFLTLPKFLLLDRELLKRGLYLTADSVRESPAELYLTGVNLYDQQARLVRFDRLEFSLGFLSLRLAGLCEGKSLQVEWSFRSLKLKTEGFGCLSGVERLSVDITVRKGIYGKVSMKGLTLQDMKAEELSLELKGRTFTAKAKFMGLELIGDGQVVFKPSDPLRSGINGQVSGAGIRLVLSGTLEKPQLLRQ